MYVDNHILESGGHMTQVSTKAELITAILGKEPRIEISGSLKDGTAKIVASGSVAWAVALGGLAIAATSISIFAATQQQNSQSDSSNNANNFIGAVGLVSAPIALGAIGISGTTLAISLITASGSLLTVKSLREYKVVKNDDNILVIERN